MDKDAQERLKVLRKARTVQKGAGKHLVPHDAGVHEYSTGLSRVEVARNHGINFRVVPKLSMEEGIDAVRNLLARCWFDEEKCSSGIKALDAYRRQWDDRYGCWKAKPVHDWSSHMADGFRMMTVGLNIAQRKGMTAEDTKRLYEKYASRV